MALSLVSGFPKVFTDTTGTLVSAHDASWRSDGTVEPKIGSFGPANWCVGQGSGRIVYNRTTANDQAVEAKFDSNGTNNPSSCGLLVRYVDTDATTFSAYQFILSGANGYLRRRNGAAGTIVELGSSPDPSGFVDGDTIYLQATGAATVLIDAQINAGGSLFGGPVSDTGGSRLTTGQCGLTFYGNYDAADDFAIYEDTGGGASAPRLMLMGVG